MNSNKCNKIHEKFFDLKIRNDLNDRNVIRIRKNVYDRDVYTIDVRMFRVQNLKIFDYVFPNFSTLLTNFQIRNLNLQILIKFEITFFFFVRIVIIDTKFAKLIFHRNAIYKRILIFETFVIFYRFHFFNRKNENDFEIFNTIEIERFRIS